MAADHLATAKSMHAEAKEQAAGGTLDQFLMLTLIEATLAVAESVDAIDARAVYNGMVLDDILTELRK